MNKRKFKKAIESVCASICDEMLTVSHNIEGVDQEKISVAVANVLGAKGTAKSNANQFFGRSYKEFNDMKDYNKAKVEFSKELFTKIRENFNAEISGALKLFNEVVPQNTNMANA